MNGYMARLDAVDHLLGDRQAVLAHHESGVRWLRECLTHALTTGQPVALLAATILMQLKVQPASATLERGLSTIAVTDRIVLVNGVAMTHPEGLVRGDMALAQSILLHEAMHLILMHTVRLTVLFRDLTAEGLICVPGRIGHETTLRIANLVLDVVDDAMTGAATRELTTHRHELMDEHEAMCRENLTRLITTRCHGLDPGFLDAVSNGQLRVEDAIRRIVTALPPTPMSPPTPSSSAIEAGESRDAGGGDGSSGDGDSVADGTGGESRPSADDLKERGAGDSDECDATPSPVRDAPEGESGDAPTIGDDTDRTGEGTLGEDLARVQVHVQTLPDAEPETIRNATLRQTAIVVAAGRQAGCESAIGQLCIDAAEWLAPPRIDWQEELELACTSIGEDLSYARIGQNDLYRGIVLPDYAPATGSVALAFDTSGSVVGDRAARRDLLGELASVLGQLPFERVYFLPCDTEVHACIELVPGDALPEEHFTGGGGTTFDPPFRYLADHALDVDAMIYFTDGHAAVIVEEPAYPVIWLLSGGTSAPNPSFGRTIRLPSAAVATDRGER